MININAEKIVVWGDSVAKGVIFDEARGRYALTKNSAVNYISEQTGVEIVNRSKMGMTVEPALALIESDIERGVTADAAFIEFGGNDCDFDWGAVSDMPDGEHQPKTTAENFETKMRAIIGKVREAGMRPFLVTLPPILSDKYFRFISGGSRSPENILHWLGDVNHIYRFHERYSMIVSKLVSDLGCELLDVRSAFLNTWDTSTFYCSDGIHPSEDGQRFIGKYILSTVNR